MITYPSIPRKGIDVPYYLFDKIDGSNIRAEFSLKKGFHRFGTRQRLLSDDSGPFLNQSKTLIEAYDEKIRAIFKEQRWEQGVLFFEFFGEHSFAGSHVEGDAFQVSLIDIHLHKKGFLPPKEFLTIFDNQIPTPTFLGISKLTKPLIEQIRKRELKGIHFEGVVGKAQAKNDILRCKVKTQDWLDKLKHYCGDNLDLYEQLK